MFPQPALQDMRERPVQFRGHHVHVQRGLSGRRGAVHLAIQAVEIALLVGIHVHAQREAARPR